MKTSLADLSRAYREHLRAQSRASLGPCLDKAALARCAFGESPRRERDRLVEHAANCLTCAEALKQFLDLSAQAESAAAALAVLEAPRRSGDPSRARSIRRWLTFWPAGAVSLAVLFLAALVVLTPRSGKFSSTRGAAGTSIDLLFPVNGTESPRAGLVLRWKGSSRASSYRVEVFDGSFQLVWRSGLLSRTELGLPDEAVRKLRPGERYYWAVAAFTEGGRQSRSKLAEFSVGK